MFGPDVVSLVSRNEFGITMTSDGREIYFSVDLGHCTLIYTVSDHDDKWSKPSILLSDNQISFNDPMLSADETRLYFMTNLNNKNRDDFDIGFMQRRIYGWSAPVIDRRISSTRPFGQGRGIYI